jgi:hypothetical protein
MDHAGVRVVGVGREMVVVSFIRTRWPMSAFLTLFFFFIQNESRAPAVRRESRSGHRRRSTRFLNGRIHVAAPAVVVEDALERHLSAVHTTSSYVYRCRFSSATNNCYDIFLFKIYFLLFLSKQEFVNIFSSVFTPVSAVRERLYYTSARSTSEMIVRMKYQ